MTPRILVVGDSYMGAELFTTAFAEHGLDVDAATIRSVGDPTWPLDGLREYEGDPAEVSELLRGHEVLAVHGAPVTRRVLESNPAVRLVACARGGPVNVDVAAARELGVTVTTTPGKNAAAVADLTIGFLITVLRNVLPSVRSVDDAARDGAPIAQSAFEGARWFGHELSGRRLGLVGLGHVARLVAARARALGVEVLAYDPFVHDDVDGVTRVESLADLVPVADVLSIHARATAENHHLVGSEQLAALPRGAYVINTARESLLDEDALLTALRSGQVAGAALDVYEPDGRWPDFVADPRVVLTPHIGGASHETLRRGAQMLAEDVAAFLAGRELRWKL